MLTEPFGWEHAQWEERYCYSHLTLNYDGHQLRNTRNIIASAKRYNDYRLNDTDGAAKHDALIAKINADNARLWQKMYGTTDF